MARKRYSDEDILKLLREIELKLADGSDVCSACRGVGVSDATYYTWRRQFGGMGRSQLSEQIVIDCWLRQYNHTRPHQALNMRPPVPETLLRTGL